MLVSGSYVTFILSEWLIELIRLSGFNPAPKHFTFCIILFCSLLVIELTIQLSQLNQPLNYSFSTCM